MQERTAAMALFERQDEERQEFVQRQINLLNEAGYDWKLPKDFEKETGYGGKGLITRKWVYNFEVLTPDDGLIYVQKGMANRPISLLGGGMTGSGAGHLNDLERTVDQKIHQLSEPKSPNLLTRLIPRLG